MCFPFGQQPFWSSFPHLYGKTGLLQQAKHTSGRVPRVKSEAILLQGKMILRFHKSVQVKTTIFNLLISAHLFSFLFIDFSLTDPRMETPARSPRGCRKVSGWIRIVGRGSGLGESMVNKQLTIGRGCGQQTARNWERVRSANGTERGEGTVSKRLGIWKGYVYSQQTLTVPSESIHMMYLTKLVVSDNSGCRRQKVFIEDAEISSIGLTCLVICRQRAFCSQHHEMELFREVRVRPYINLLSNYKYFFSSCGGLVQDHRWAADIAQVEHA